MTKLRIGVIGAGAFARDCHLPGLQSHPRAEVVAVCGSDRRRTRLLADEYSVADVYTDYRELCRRDDIDAVTIVSSPTRHPAQAIAALKQGKHVFCEKPLGMNVAQVSQMIEVARASRRVHQTAFTFRYLYGVDELRRRLRAGDIGEPFFTRIQYDGWAGLQPNLEPGWRGEREVQGPGMLLDLGVHLFDIVRFALGPIATVAGFTHNVPRSRFDRRSQKRVTVTADDLVSTWFSLASGVRGQWFASRVTPKLTDNGFLEVVGTEGALKAALSRGGVDVLMLSTPMKPDWEEQPLPADAGNSGPRCLTAMMHSFVDACLRGSLNKDVDASFEDGLAAQKCVEAVVTSNQRQMGPIECLLSCLTLGFSQLNCLQLASHLGVGVV